MKKYLIFLLVCLVALVGCTQPSTPPAINVNLSSPVNGGTVSSLTPILAWNSNTSGASYRIQVATDNAFSNLIVDQSNLSGESYNIPAGKLSQGQAYYWKVRATKGSQTSDWTPFWSFKTPAEEPPPSPELSTDIKVSATLDGVSWSGDLLWRGVGPTGETGEFDEVPETYYNLETGVYSVSYVAGGPPGSTLVGITPDSTQVAIEDSTTNFTFNFITDATTTIQVEATLDGRSWSGNINYTLKGPTVIRDNRVRRTYTDLPVGIYTLIYNYGGPSGAILYSISPKPTQTAVANGVTVFTMHFYTEATNVGRVRATLDGSEWIGDLTYEAWGSQGGSYRFYTVPDNFTDLPDDVYSVNYLAGGPPGAIFAGISPSAVQSVGGGSVIIFTFNFVSIANGDIIVDATLDDLPWDGQLRYNISGPSSDTGVFVPDRFRDFPEGSYTITYLGGGPSGAELYDIRPGSLQILSPGGRIRFTFRFYTTVAVPLPEIPEEPIEVLPMPEIPEPEVTPF